MLPWRLSGRANSTFHLSSLDDAHPHWGQPPGLLPPPNSRLPSPGHTLRDTSSYLGTKGQTRLPIRGSCCGDEACDSIHE